jgi:hypothetical protein
MNKNSVLILTTDSDFYQYIKQAIPGEAKSLSAPVSRGTTLYAGNVGVKAISGKNAGGDCEESIRLEYFMQ